MVKKIKKPETRYLNDIKIVLYDKKWAKEALNCPVYYVYRGVRKKEGLRYDITAIPPKMLGSEFPKTKGHEHIKNYQEVYQVLRGKAIFLIQRVKNGRVEDVYVISAKKGGVVIVPKKYGHITINPGKEKLKVVNWIDKNCKNNYALFEDKKGACYFYTKFGWVKNKNYKKIPKLRFGKPLKKMPKNLRSFLERAGSSP